MRLRPLPFTWSSEGGFLQVPNRVLAVSIIQPVGTEISPPSAICECPTTLDI